MVHLSSKLTEKLYMLQNTSILEKVRFPEVTQFFCVLCEVHKEEIKCANAYAPLQATFGLGVQLSDALTSTGSYLGLCSSLTWQLQRVRSHVQKIRCISVVLIDFNVFPIITHAWSERSRGGHFVNVLWGLLMSLERFLHLSVNFNIFPKIVLLPITVNRDLCSRFISKFNFK